MARGGRSSGRRAGRARSTARRHAAGGGAAGAGPGAPADAAQGGDDALLSLAIELEQAEAAWANASRRYAEAERRHNAMRPRPPRAILVSQKDDPGGIAPAASWPELREELLRRYRHDPARAARIAAARAQWRTYQAALARRIEPERLREAEAAEAAAADRVEAIQTRIAAIRATTWQGLRLKLRILWAWSGYGTDIAEPREDEPEKRLLWSLLRDAEIALADRS